MTDLKKYVCRHFEKMYNREEEQEQKKKALMNLYVSLMIYKHILSFEYLNTRVFGE